MFRHRTTFIVGAGASCELNLPSGDQLKQLIFGLLELTPNNAYGFTDMRLIEALQTRHGPNMWNDRATLERVQAAARTIRRGLPLAVSIDNFLHTHQENEEVIALGKVAIAISILESEAESKLFKSTVPATQLLMGRSPEPHLDATSEDILVTTWYPLLVQLLMAGVDRRDMAAAFRNVRFIIFNYDRCLEQFLFMALQIYFDCDEQAAAEVLRDVDFVHPYGSLGPLPWQYHTRGEALALGMVNGVNHYRIAQNIRTFTESVESELGEKVKDTVGSSNTIVTLGFGFLEQNVTLLRPVANRAAGWLIATAYGVSPQDQNAIAGLLRGWGHDAGPQFSVVPSTCRGLFEQHRIGLSTV